MSWKLPNPPTPRPTRPAAFCFCCARSPTPSPCCSNSTNQWSGTIHDVDFTNCALHLEDLVNSRPARLDLDDITFTAKNISNLPHTNLTADLSLRWNTNGAIHTGNRRLLFTTDRRHRTVALQSGSRHARPLSRTQGKPVHPRQPARPGRQDSLCARRKTNCRRSRSRATRGSTIFAPWTASWARIC